MARGGLGMAMHGQSRCLTLRAEHLTEQLESRAAHMRRESVICNRTVLRNRIQLYRVSMNAYGMCLNGKISSYSVCSDEWTSDLGPHAMIYVGVAPYRIVHDCDSWLWNP